jgi:hypothetical protein
VAGVGEVAASVFSVAQPATLAVAVRTTPMVSARTRPRWRCTKPMKTTPKVDGAPRAALILGDKVS